MKLMVRQLISGLLTVSMLAGLGLYIWLHRGEAAAIMLVSPLALVVCACALIGCMVAVGPLFYLMINGLNRCVSLRECIWLSILTTAVNTLVPFQGGAGVRAVYLKRRYGFDYSSFLATLYGYQVLRVLVCALCGAVAVLWLVLGEGRTGLAPILTGTLLCLAVSLVACALPRLPATGRWLMDRLAAFTQGWHTLRAQPKVLALMVGLVALQLAAEVLTFWTACAALGLRLAIPEVVAVGTLSILVTVLGLTPSGLGLFEAMAAFVSSAMSINPVHSVMAALVARFVLLALLLILTPVAVYSLSRGWKSAAPAPAL